MNWLMFAMQIISAIPSLVTTAETAFSGKPGSGAYKKKLVMDSVMTGLSLSPAFGTPMTDDQKKAVEQVSSTMVDAVVTTINAFENRPTVDGGS